MDEAALTTIHGEISSRLERQRTSSNRVDTKLTGILTLCLASVPLGLWSHLEWRLAAPAVSIAAAAALAIGGLWVRGLWDAPIPRVLAEHYMELPAVEVLDRLIGTKVVVFERNAVLAARKARLWRYSASMLLLAAAAGALAQL